MLKKNNKQTNKKEQKQKQEQEQNKKISLCCRIFRDNKIVFFDVLQSKAVPVLIITTHLVPIGFEMFKMATNISSRPKMTFDINM